MGGGPGAAGGVDAVQQRPAARGDHRDRRTDHLCPDRAGDHLGSLDACCAGDRYRGLHARHSADGTDSGRGAARRWPAAAANPGAQTPHRRNVAAGCAAAGRGHRGADGDLRRPDAGNRAGGHQNSHRDRPEPGVVHREPALLLSDPADGRRFAVAPLRLPDHRAEPVRRRCSSCCGASGFPGWHVARHGG